MINLHFIYPYWFLLLPILAGIYYFLYKKIGTSAIWDRFVDPALQPYVLTGDNPESSKQQWVLWGLGALLMVIALSGPSIRQQDVPAYQVQNGLVVALDLSSSMMAEDSKPNRLQKAKFELSDLVQGRTEGQTGLVVFAADAFSVSPLTNEASTITSQVEHLTPEIMPVQGSRVDRAIDESVQLLQQAGYKKGHILLFTDGIADQAKAIASAEKALEAHFDVSVLAFGTEKGSTIPVIGGGTMTTEEGDEVISRLDSGSLKSLAKAGNGLYLRSVAGDKDLRKLLKYYKSGKNMTLMDADQQLGSWINSGIWFLFPLIPLFLLLFRKSYLFVFVLFILPQAQPVHAYEWESIWLNDNQRGKQAFDEGRMDEAKEVFSHKQWKAVMAFRDGDYEQSKVLFSLSDNIEARYNHGTALAKMGEYEEAIEVFEDVLKQQPDHEDAAYNLELLKQQESDSQNGSQGEEQESNSQNDQEGTGQQGESEEDSKDEKDNQEKNEEESETDQEEDSEKQDSSENDQSDKEKQEKEETTEQERSSHSKQILRRIPDDSSGLWRRKFKLQYEQRGKNRHGRGQRSEGKPW